MTTAVDDALDRLYARVAVNEKACADLATVRAELQRLRGERMTVFNLNAEHDERVVAPYVERAEAAEHDLAMERSLNADYKAANDCAATERDQWKAANTEAMERVRQLEDGLRDIADPENDASELRRMARALLADDSPPEGTYCDAARPEIP